MTTVFEVQVALAHYVEALTPSGGTKAEYSGEFKFSIDVVCEDPDTGEWVDVPQEVTVPWTTVKEIMKAIKARAERAGDA